MLEKKPKFTGLPSNSHAGCLLHTGTLRRGIPPLLRVDFCQFNSPPTEYGVSGLLTPRGSASLIQKKRNFQAPALEEKRIGGGQTGLGDWYSWGWLIAIKGHCKQISRK